MWFFFCCSLSCKTILEIRLPGPACEIWRLQMFIECDQVRRNKWLSRGQQWSILWQWMNRRTPMCCRRFPSGGCAGGARKPWRRWGHLQYTANTPHWCAGSVVNVNKMCGSRSRSDLREGSRLGDRPQINVWFGDAGDFAQILSLSCISRKFEHLTRHLFPGSGSYVREFLWWLMCFKSETSLQVGNEKIRECVQHDWHE